MSFRSYGVNGTTVTGTSAYRSIVTAIGKNGRLTGKVKFTQTIATLAGVLVVQICSLSDQEIAAAGGIASVSASDWDTYDLISVPAISGSMSVPIKLTNLAEGTIVSFLYTNATGAGTIKSWVRTS